MELKIKLPNLKFEQFSKNFHKIENQNSNLKIQKFHSTKVAHVQPVGEPSKRLDQFNRSGTSKWIQTETASKVSANQGRIEVSVRQNTDGWKPEGWIDYEKHREPEPTSGNS